MKAFFSSSTILLGRLLVLLLGLCGLTGCETAESKPPEVPPPLVTVCQPVNRQIVEWDAYTGRLEAVDFVEVRSRVSGYLQSVYFDEGQMVSKGDLLMQIDPRPFESELASAEAALRQAESQVEQARAQAIEVKTQKLQAESQLELAEVRVKRTRSLLQGDAASQDQVDQYESEYQQALASLESSKASIVVSEAAIETARAAVDSARAGVEMAKLNLSYTKLYSPVSGRISESYVSEGNLVSGGTATSTLLTTITSVQPMYCTFDANEQEVLKYMRLSSMESPASFRDAKNPVYLGLVDENGFPHEGHMDFVDNLFNSATATMRARCVFRNENELLLPGMFARLRIPGSLPYSAVLIPDSAIGTDQSSQYVYVVVNDVIERRAVSVGPLVDGLRVVREGLQGDESLVIEGLLKIRPKMNVRTEQGKIEIIEDGLPNDYLPVPPEKWISPSPAPLPEADASADKGGQL